MIIRPEEIANKKIIGTLKGQPVIEVRTIGGFFILLSGDNKPKILSCGSHPKICHIIAKRQNPEIEFSDLQKSDLEFYDSITGNIVEKYEKITTFLVNKYNV